VTDLGARANRWELAGKLLLMVWAALWFLGQLGQSDISGRDPAFLVFVYACALFFAGRASVDWRW
jgi:hypothetical protein